MFPFSRLRGALVAAAVCGASTPAFAQAPAVGVPAKAETECAYSTCALTIAPRWSGLAVVRGANGRQLANLNFFWPRDVTAALRGLSASTPGADSAAAQARRAVRLRRIGAALTDAGIIVGALGGTRAVRAGRLRRSDAVMLGAGGAALGLSVPFQFAADGALSRAVWWHNLRYAR